MRILHTGDIHLDSPFAGLDISCAQKRRRELRETFSRMMRYAREERVDMVLIAGDLFDGAFVTRETVILLLREFASLECPVIIAPGNHDPYEKGGIWEKTVFPKNVHIFKENTLTKIDFDDLGCTVYGYGFTDTYENECPVKGTVEDNGRINILVAHGDVMSPISSYAPLPVSVLKAFGADYVALGHIHNTDAANEALEGIGAYCGCPEGRDFGETGEKGALEVHIDDETVTVTFVPFAKRAYITHSVSIDGAESLLTVKTAVDNAVRALSDGKENLVRLILRGSVSPSLNLNVEALSEDKRGLFHLEIEDATSPTWNGDSLKNDPGIRGELYRTLLPKLESEHEEERKTASDALRYALAALAGEDILEI
ncbi:MAG: DNA repair exonuclease [Clostridia bacterium]|nr:DNA repair exonuclease [Clostridia bacterium]